MWDRVWLPDGAAERMAARRPFFGVAGTVYTGTIACVSWLWLDERLDIRRWKTIHHSVSHGDGRGGGAPIHLSLRARTRPPPIGQMEWPGGRVLLQWALDEAGLDAPGGGTVLTIGEGIGVTAIGLALARHAAATDGARVGAVIATDGCDETLELLRSNAAAHGFNERGDERGGATALAVRKWDAAAGAAAVARLPVPLGEVSDVIGSDVVYHGFGQETDATGRGLELTLRALLDEKPSLRVRLLVADRFSGGAVAALSGAAGVDRGQMPPTTVDPALAAFECACERLGLEVDKAPLPPALVAAVRGSQPLHLRLYCWLAGFYDGMAVWTVRRRAPEPPST